MCYLHSVRSIADPICRLQFTHVLDDRGNLAVRDLRLRGHVAEWPVMPANALSCGQNEGSIGMMSRIVDVMDERRALVGACFICAMTKGTIRIECSLPGLGGHGQLRRSDVHRDKSALPAGAHVLPEPNAGPCDKEGNSPVPCGHSIQPFVVAFVKNRVD